MTFSLSAQTVQCGQSSDADIVIAFDFTGSTTAFNLSEQKRAVNELLDFFEPAFIRPNIGYVTFNTRNALPDLHARVVKTITSDYDLLRRLVDENLTNGEIAGAGGDPVAAGGTHIGEGIDAAQAELDANANPATANYIILISDGDTNLPGLNVVFNCNSCSCPESEGLAVAASQNAISAGTILFTIHYNGNELCPLENGEVSGQSFLREDLASSIGHAFVSGEDNLEEVFTQISEVINCDDGLDCTQDSCDLDTGQCIFQELDEDNDGNLDCEDLCFGDDSLIGLACNGGDDDICLLYTSDAADE